jgi:histidinol-phosphatase (PHP family)
VPEGDLRRYYEPAVAAMADAGVAVEVSTAGLRKPAGEIYPAPAFLSMCVDAGVPIALSSDAHVPEDVGRDYAQALELLARTGVRELSTFAGRRRSSRAIEEPAPA